MKTITMLVVVVAVGGLAFWGGTKYESSHAASAATTRTARFGTGGNSGIGRAGGTGAGAAFAGGTVGKVISKDATSITVQLSDGSTRIVFLSNTTPVMKTVTGTNSDVAVGQNVLVTGTTNSDGSVTASQVQIRPNLPSPSPTPSQ